MLKCLCQEYYINILLVKSRKKKGNYFKNIKKYVSSISWNHEIFSMAIKELSFLPSLSFFPPPLLSTWKSLRHSVKGNNEKYVLDILLKETKYILKEGSHRTICWIILFLFKNYTYICICKLNFWKNIFQAAHRVLSGGRIRELHLWSCFQYCLTVSNVHVLILIMKTAKLVMQCAHPHLP